MVDLQFWINLSELEKKLIARGDWLFIVLAGS